jgi:hypothetical protein
LEARREGALFIEAKLGQMLQDQEALAIPDATIFHAVCGVEIFMSQQQHLLIDDFTHFCAFTYTSK